jgi:hypothetical protein
MTIARNMQVATAANILVRFPVMSVMNSLATFRL